MLEVNPKTEMLFVPFSSNQLELIQLLLHAHSIVAFVPLYFVGGQKQRWERRVVQIRGCRRFRPGTLLCDSI